MSGRDDHNDDTNDQGGRFSPPLRPEQVTEKTDPTLGHASPSGNNSDPVEALFDTLQSEEQKLKRFRQSYQNLRSDEVDDSDDKERQGSEAFLDRYLSWLPHRRAVLVALSFFLVGVSGWALLSTITSRKDTLKTDLRNEMNQNGLNSNNADSNNANQRASAARKNRDQALPRSRGGSEVRYSKDRDRPAGLSRDRNQGEEPSARSALLRNDTENRRKTPANEDPADNSANDNRPYNSDEGGQRISSDSQFDVEPAPAPEDGSGDSLPPIGGDENKPYEPNYEDIPEAETTAPGEALAPEESSGEGVDNYID